MKEITFDEVTIRGTVVTVHCDEYMNEPDVGIFEGFANVWAETEDGQDFPLTDEEQSKYSRLAVDSANDRAQEMELEYYMWQQKNKGE